MEETLDFGEAIEALKQGKRVARTGWNGKGMWLKLVPAYGYDLMIGVQPPVPGHTMTIKIKGEVVGEAQSIQNEPKLLPWIGMKTADNCFVPWLASQTDILAEDWVIL